jgi:hypothetical protein
MRIASEKGSGESRTLFGGGLWGFQRVPFSSSRGIFLIAVPRMKQQATKRHHFFDADGKSIFGPAFRIRWTIGGTIGAMMITVPTRPKTSRQI